MLTKFVEYQNEILTQTEDLGPDNTIYCEIFLILPRCNKYEMQYIQSCSTHSLTRYFKTYSQCDNLQIRKSKKGEWKMPG